MRTISIRVMGSSEDQKADPHQRRELAPGKGPISSRDLLGKRGELVIEHSGREYRLRVTQNGKLILTA